MRHLAIIICISALAASFAIPADAAQNGEQQWLSYKNSFDAAKVIGATPGQSLEVLSEHPESATLPDVLRNAMFAKWKTPMVEQGFLWVAVLNDKESRKARLWIDADCDGSLADEAPVEAVKSQGYGSHHMSSFQAVRVVFPTADGPVAFHLDFEFRVSGSQAWQLSAAAAGWYEGPVTIGDAQGRCILFDANANGAFDDACLNVAQSDRIRLDIGEKLMIGRVGKYIQVGDVLHQLHVARDGAFVAFSPTASDALATLKVPAGVTQLSIGGENGLLFLKPKDGVIGCPPGRYRLNHWEMTHSDTGGPWEMIGVLPASPFEFSLESGNPTELDIGEPIVGEFFAEKNGKAWSFANPSLTGRHGERISITRAGNQPPAPMVRITNGDGSYNHRFNFEYG